MQCGAILAPCDCPPLVPGPLILPEPRCAPARPCPRAPPTTQPCSQPPDKRPRAQASESQKSASAAVSAPILHQMRMDTTAAAAEHAQVDLELASNWCGRAPRALMPSPACARKGRNRVPGQLQGREGVPGGGEGTPISANPPRFCPTPVSASSPATLWKGDRGMWAGEPVCSQTASSERSFSHTRSSSAGGPTDPRLRSKQRPVTKSWRADCDDGAPSPDALRGAHEPRLCPSPARAAVWARLIGALWGGRRRRCSDGGSPRGCQARSARKSEFSPTVLYPKLDKVRASEWQRASCIMQEITGSLVSLPVLPAQVISA